MSAAQRLVWNTRMVRGEPRDIRFDADTGKPVAMASWTAPLQPLQPDHCANCGHVRRAAQQGVTAMGGGIRDVAPACENCGMTAREDWRTHMLVVTRLGCGNFIEAADKAQKRGQLVLALKLATAGFHYGDWPDRSRGLRLELLETVGVGYVAIAEAEAWRAETQDAPESALVIAAFHHRADRLVQAVRALDATLMRAPNAREVRLARAKLLLAAGSPQECIEDVQVCLADTSTDSVAEQALDVVAELVRAYLADHRVEDAMTALDMVAPSSHHYAPTAFLLGMSELRRGQLSRARRWLLHSLQLDPNYTEALAPLEQLERELGLPPTQP